MQHYPAAVIWDLDGTLVDSAPDLAAALNALLREQGHAQVAAEQVRGMIGDGVAKLIERGFAAAGVRLGTAQLDELLPRFLLIYAAGATDRTRLYAGARQVLQHFADSGARQGVCTNKPEGLSQQILDALSVGRYFGAVVGGDTTAAKKPQPLPLRTCLAELGVTARDSVLIGDSAVDVAAARA